MWPYKGQSFNIFKDKLTFVSYFHVLHFSARKPDMDRMKHDFILAPYLILRHTHKNTPTNTHIVLFGVPHKVCHTIKVFRIKRATLYRYSAYK